MCKCVANKRLRKIVVTKHARQRLYERYGYTWNADEWSLALSNVQSRVHYRERSKDSRCHRVALHDSRQPTIVTVASGETIYVATVLPRLGKGKLRGKGTLDVRRITVRG